MEANADLCRPMPTNGGKWTQMEHPSTIGSRGILQKIGITFKLAFKLLQNLANPPIYFEQIKKAVDPQKSPTHPTLLTAMFEIGICGFF